MKWISVVLVAAISLGCGATEDSTGSNKEAVIENPKLEPAGSYVVSASIEAEAIGCNGLFVPKQTVITLTRSTFEVSGWLAGRLILPGTVQDDGWFRFEHNYDYGDEFGYTFIDGQVEVDASGNHTIRASEFFDGHEDGSPCWYVVTYVGAR